MSEQKKIQIPKPIMVDPKKLKLNPKNVKRHDEKQLHDLGVLYEMIGFTDPIIADKKNVVWAGNGSLLEALEKNMSKVPVVYIPDEWTKDQKKIFMLMDNKITESPWEFANFKPVFDAVSPQLGELFQADFSKLVDLSNMELNIIDPDEQELLAPSATPRAKLGEIYQLGNHRLMCGDATKDLDKLTGDQKPALLFTDPPYGIDIVHGGNTDVSTNLGFVGIEDKPKSSLAKARIYKSIIADDKPFNPNFLLKLANSIIIFGANHFASKLPDNSHWLVWDKKLEGGLDHNNFSDVELAWTNIKKKSCLIYRHLWSGLLREGDRKTELKERVHPTQKPVGLLSHIVMDYSNENDIILDPYAGSGSIIISCEITKRICYAMELDPAYVDVMIDRWENYTGKKAELLKL